MQVANQQARSSVVQWCLVRAQGLHRAHIVLSKPVLLVNAHQMAVRWKLQRNQTVPIP
jgi:hypothetical protein